MLDRATGKPAESRAKRERHALQAALVLAACVPLAAGVAGVLVATDGSVGGPLFTGSHLRYLSGLLTTIGLAAMWVAGDVEARGEAMSLIAAIVVGGGAARLFGLAHGDPPSTATVFSLIMELGVTPCLWAWRRRVANLRARG